MGMYAACPLRMNKTLACSTTCRVPSAVVSHVKTKGILEPYNVVLIQKTEHTNINAAVQPLLPAAPCRA